MHGGQHPGVGAPEVPEVVVRRVLATENRVMLSHRGLDEGVTNPSDHNLAAGGLHDLPYRPGRDLVADDGRAWHAPQFGTGDHRGDSRGAHHFALLVEYEASISVAVEHQREVRAALLNSAGGIDQVIRLERVGWMIREGPVGIGV